MGKAGGAGRLDQGVEKDCGEVEHNWLGVSHFGEAWKQRK